MQFLEHPNQITQTHDSPGVAHPDESPQAQDCPLIPEGFVYDLRLKNGSSDCFYEEVAHFSDRLLAVIDFRAGDVIDAYATYVQNQKRETPRSHGEYAIEFLMLGLVLRRYSAAAENTPGWIARLAHGLFRFRRVSRRIKPAADFLRAAIARIFLVPKIGDKTPSGWQPLAGLPRLINWLQATGEFEQETPRLQNWRSYLDTLPQVEAERLVETAADLFEWFRGEAARAWAPCTGGVPRFLAGEHRRRGWREDQIFCAKEPVEYHLNMVAAEIMNRGLRDDFVRTRRRVVLVPGCMRGARASKCKARVKDTDIRCAACDPTCDINHITRRMRAQGVDVFIVPHSTGFSRWLERWQREPDCGVTAVACLLNIVPGGLEMRARGIASQCVVLDYPGCQKHWHREGIATALNENLLVRIVAASSPR